MMVVLLKNLVARAPQTEDLGAVSHLIGSCENTGASIAHASLAELLPRWQETDFHLATDAWVIVTTRGQVVGFACVWHEDHTSISTFVCVHPAYRNRGIGTLLLRLVEVRARQEVRFAPPDARVVLRGLISEVNEGAQHLFEREGYTPGQPALRIAYRQAEVSIELPLPSAQRSGETDLKPSKSLSLTAHPIVDYDSLCTIHLYSTYEKELRHASTCGIGTPAGSKRHNSPQYPAHLAEAKASKHDRINAVLVPPLH